MKLGWAGRPSFLDGRDAHPTITIKIVSYLIRVPKKTKGDRRVLLELLIEERNLQHFPGK
ncbi:MULTISPECIES: hypothetical protein [unclassified Microcoleus]|uniref:hypothetical protein n=1 Tax=unclassified Microcoleus TaxID=2642155 RepID=UPI002FD376DC